MAGGEDYGTSPGLSSGQRLNVLMSLSNLSSMHAEDVFHLPASNDDEGLPA